MAPKRFVATAPIGYTAIDILEQIAPVEIAPMSDEATIMGLSKGTIGLVCRGEGRASSKLISVFEELRVIGRPGAGYDSVDIAAANSRNIPVVYAPVGGFAVAEGALALLMALVKDIQLCDEIVKRGEWRRRYDIHTGDLTGHTLGIIGLGRIGVHLAKLAQPFEMTILAYEPVTDHERMRELGIVIVELDELLQRSDYISLHVSLNDLTQGLINRQRIASMKKGAILINTSRGRVVESLDVLADALESNQLGGVGLDVFPIEPPDISHRLFKHPRCICAPHLVGVSKLAMERIYTSMAKDMVAVIQGRRPIYCVNPEVLV